MKFLGNRFNGYIAVYNSTLPILGHLFIDFVHNSLRTICVFQSLTSLLSISLGWDFRSCIIGLKTVV